MLLAPNEALPRSGRPSGKRHSRRELARATLVWVGGWPLSPGPTAVRPPAPSTGLWGAGQQQAPLAQAHRISETTVKPFRGTTEVLMDARFYA